MSQLEAEAERGEKPALGAYFIIPLLASGLTIYYLVSTLDLNWEARSTGTFIGVITEAAQVSPGPGAGFAEGFMPGPAPGAGAGAGSGSTKPPPPLEPPMLPLPIPAGGDGAAPGDPGSFTSFGGEQPASAPEASTIQT